MVGLHLKAVVAGVPQAFSLAPDHLYRTLLRAHSVADMVRGKPLGGLIKLALNKSPPDNLQD